MDEVLNLIARIYLASQSLHEHTLAGPPHYDIAIDKELGEIEALVYEARQAISDEWRINTAKGPKPFISHLDLEELGL